MFKRVPTNFRARKSINQMICETMENYDMNRTEAIEHLIANGHIRIKNVRKARSVIH